MIARTSETVQLAGAAWQAGEVAPRDGFASHVVMVVDGPAVGEWWPIMGHDETDLTLGTAGESLATRLEPGTVVEVLALPTVASVFGLAGTPAQRVVGKDTIAVYADARSSGWTLLCTTNSSGGSVYCVSRDGIKTGPFDGSTLTILPAQSFSYLRKTGSPDPLFASGPVQHSALVHYVSPGSIYLASAYPVSSRLAKSGLADSGWLRDSNFSMRSSDEDIIYAFNASMRESATYYHRGTVRAAGWYESNGTSATQSTLQPGLACQVSMVKRSGWVRWFEPVPWN